MSFIETYFADRLRELSYNALADVVYIPKNRAAIWWSKATGHNVHVREVQSRARCLIDSGVLTILKTCGTGLLWLPHDNVTRIERDVNARVRLVKENRLHSDV